MTRTQLIICWLLQITAAVILGYAGTHKLISNHQTVEVFTILEMEPTGRYIIGILELLATFFLLTSTLAAVGAIIGVSIMLGAIIAHSTVLGPSPALFLLATVMICCLTIAYIRKEQLPLIGRIMS